MFLIDVIWYGILLVVFGLVFYSTPEWVRKQYTNAAKRRKATPKKRPEWQASEQKLGLVMMAAGIGILVLRLVLDGIIVDVIATLVLFAMILWRVFGFLSD